MSKKGPLACLKGVTISKVVHTAQDTVSLFDAGGIHYYSIRVDTSCGPISTGAKDPILTCTKHKIKKIKKPEVIIWPYPKDITNG